MAWLAKLQRINAATRLHCPLLTCTVRPPRQALMNTKSDMELNLVYPGHPLHTPAQVTTLTFTYRMLDLTFASSTVLRDRLGCVRLIPEHELGLNSGSPHKQRL